MLLAGLLSLDNASANPGLAPAGALAVPAAAPVEATAALPAVAGEFLSLLGLLLGESSSQPAGPDPDAGAGRAPVCSGDAPQVERRDDSSEREQGEASREGELAGERSRMVLPGPVPIPMAEPPVVLRPAPPTMDDAAASVPDAAGPGQGGNSEAVLFLPETRPVPMQELPLRPTAEPETTATAPPEPEKIDIESPEQSRLTAGRPAVIRGETREVVTTGFSRSPVTAEVRGRLRSGSGDTPAEDSLSRRVIGAAVAPPPAPEADAALRPAPDPVPSPSAGSAVVRQMELSAPGEAREAPVRGSAPQTSSPERVPAATPVPSFEIGATDAEPGATPAPGSEIAFALRVRGAEDVATVLAPLRARDLHLQPQGTGEGAQTTRPTKSEGFAARSAVSPGPPETSRVQAPVVPQVHPAQARERVVATEEAPVAGVIPRAPRVDGRAPEGGQHPGKDREGDDESLREPVRREVSHDKSEASPSRPASLPETRTSNDARTGSSRPPEAVRSGIPVSVAARATAWSAPGATDSHTPSLRPAFGTDARDAGPGDAARETIAGDDLARAEVLSAEIAPARAPGEAVRRMSLNVSAPESERRVAVDLVERGGRLHVAVRSEDGNLNSALRQELGDLVTRLERTGYGADSWSPEATGAGLRERSAHQSTIPPGEHSRQDVTRRDTAPDSNADQQGRRNQPEWLEELRPKKQVRVEESFLWHLQSIG